MAVAWEGAGAVRAAGLTSVPVLGIRGMTDSANHDAPGDFETHLKCVMTNIAHLLNQMVLGKTGKGHPHTVLIEAKTPDTRRVKALLPVPYEE